MPIQERQLLTQLVLPWYSQEGELSYSAMTLAHPNGICKRKAIRVMRKWYKNSIGISVSKLVLERLWQRRQVTPVMTEETIQQHLHDMAVQSHEENNQSTDTGIQEETSSGAEL